MRRPAPEVLWTLVLVLVIAGAGAGVALVAVTRDGGSSTTPPAPDTSSTAPSSPA